MEQEAWRILIVEDDRRLAELTREYLEGNGLKVDIEANGALAAARILAERPDLVVLDLMLPGEDGLSICRQVRPQFDGPILMLTARTDDMDEVLGLETFAADTAAKAAPAADSKRLAFGRLVIDNAMREAWLDGTTIELTSAEFDLLWLLAANAGRILSREEIFNALRGIEYDGQDRSIDVRISRIRPKIGDDPMHPRLIKTVRSKGYLFVGEG